MITIKNIRPFIGGKLHDNTNMLIDNSKIVDFGDMEEGTVIDGNNAICCAGYIEIHSHGGWGKDCMEPTQEAISTIAQYQLATGVTSFVPTTMTASIEDIEKAINNIKQYHGKGARILGVHLEGPFLAKKSAGAHPAQYLIAPTANNVQWVWDNVDMVKRITLAPNLEGSAEFCKMATDKGIQISLGHDDSIDDEIMACVKNGATSVTHMYNCTSKPSRRENPKKHLGLTEMGLIEKSLICEVIADNRHVPNILFDMIYKLKGKDSICFVSDSLSIAGMPQGDYYIGSGQSAQAIRVEDGVAVLPKENTYAGSITPISTMVVNMHAYGYSKEDCLTMGSLNPAKVINLKDRGDLQKGMLADFNLLDDKLQILGTYLGGEKQ